MCVCITGTTGTMIAEKDMFIIMCKYILFIYSQQCFLDKKFYYIAEKIQENIRKLQN